MMYKILLIFWFLSVKCKKIHDLKKITFSTHLFHLVVLNTKIYAYEKTVFDEATNAYFDVKFKCRKCNFQAFRAGKLAKFSWGAYSAPQDPQLLISRTSYARWALRAQPHFFHWPGYGVAPPPYGMKKILSTPMHGMNHQILTKCRT